MLFEVRLDPVRKLVALLGRKQSGHELHRRRVPVETRKRLAVFRQPASKR
jgi:hypothetical protein